MENLKANFEELIRAIGNVNSTLEISERSLGEISLACEHTRKDYCDEIIMLKEKIKQLEAELESTKQALVRIFPSEIYKLHEPGAKDNQVDHFIAQEAQKQEIFAMKIMSGLEISLEEQQINQSVLKNIAVLAEETNALWHALEKNKPDES